MSGKFLLLGSNLNDRLTNLSQACLLLIQDEIQIIRSSSIYETEPFGIAEQPWFLNVVLEIETILEPDELLEVCLGVEQKMGRVRSMKWAERLIDVDILYYDDQILEEHRLTIPHSGIPDRRFTLKPLAELAPDFIHPVFRKTNKELLNSVSDSLKCRKTQLALPDDLA